MGKITAGLVVFRRINGTVEYLLLQSTKSTHHWTPPKGHPDRGESDLEAAYRETLEESGLGQFDLKLFPDSKITISYIPKKKLKTVHYWVAQLINEKAEVKLSHEHQAFKWLGLKKACVVVEHKAMQDMLLECDKFIRKNV